MTRHTATLAMRPPNRIQRTWHRRMNTTPPLMETRHPIGDIARLVPYRVRWFHRAFAAAAGYCWLPCVLCDRPYGGHEEGGSIPDPTGGAHCGIAVCSRCFRERAAGLFDATGGTPRLPRRYRSAGS